MPQSRLFVINEEICILGPPLCTLGLWPCCGLPVEQSMEKYSGTVRRLIVLYRSTRHVVCETGIIPTNPLIEIRNYTITEFSTTIVFGFLLISEFLTSQNRPKLVLWTSWGSEMLCYGRACFPHVAPYRYHAGFGGCNASGRSGLLLTMAG